MKTITLFDDQRLTLEKSIELAAESIRTYGSNYKVWVCAFSGGKDSSCLVSLIIHLIEQRRVPKPEKLVVLFSDTRMELTPLQISAMGILEEVKKRGHFAKVVMAPIDKRFLVYILGRGVPPPSNTMRWCTRQIKVDPMMAALDELKTTLGVNERLLMLTGVRLGESAVRDQRISISCSKNGGECGQGWFQSMTAPQTDTLAPILGFRVCHVWDWLMFEAPLLGFPTTAIAQAYGGEEAEEINARTGCIGCPLASKDTALDNLVKQSNWSYLTPLKQLRPIYEWMRRFDNRLQKDGTETRKDGSLVKNPGRKGPLTIDARIEALEKILSIQQQVNEGARVCGRPPISLINAEEESRIRELIALKTFPNGWSGTEPRGDVLLPEVYPDGSVQPLLF